MKYSKISGKVYLIGAGPGDPSLITLKGKQCLQMSGVVIYDSLVNTELLKLAAPEAEKIYVGKKGKQHTKEQDEINLMLMEYAMQGKIVARLKGGDPFVFGRGAEEAEFLAEHKISFEIVPGISSAIAVPAYAGIPVTSRDYNSMLTVVTGHERGDKIATKIEWDKISSRSTLVILMGIENLSLIINELLRHNWDVQTPVALVRHGTLPDQEILAGTLSNILVKAEKADFKPPAVIIVGKVVKLRKKLRWFDNKPNNQAILTSFRAKGRGKPLFGRKVLITRAREQASELAELLEDKGADVVQFPTIKIVAPEDYKALDRAIGELNTYNWLIFTSVNGVEYFYRRLKKQNVKLHYKLKTCAIGPKTAERMTSSGIRVDRVAKEYQAEAIIIELGNLKGKRILIPRAKTARKLLPEELKKSGAYVNVVTAYRTKKDTSNLKEVKNLLLCPGARQSSRVDCITFTSSSTVKNFMECFSPAERKKIFKNTRAASIGPVTSKTLITYSVKPDIIAEKSTIEYLTEGIIHYFRG